jgi:glycosyltransferase involved in cell wall biosynthesis
MRIALAASSFSPYIGGVEEHVRHVARTLRARGHDVVVWTISREGALAVREVDGIEVRDLPAPLPARSIGDIARFLARLPRAALAWWRAERAFRPDVIHVHCFGPNGTYARWVSRLTRTPMIVTTHGETLADDDGLFTHSRLARESLRASLEAASAVTGCSQLVLDDLVDRFGLAPGRGVVVFNGIDRDEAPPEPVADLPDRFIAGIGRLQRMKGFDLLIDAYAASGVAPDIGLVIGGAGPEADALRRRAEELGVGRDVVLPGRLSRGQVATVLDRAALVVVPSRFEAFGLTALEAWRAGAPLVATTRGGMREFVREGVDGLIVDPESTPSLADAITALVADRDRARRLAEAGHARLPEFAWDRIAERYEALYRAAAVSDGRRAAEPAAASDRRGDGPST